MPRIWFAAFALALLAAPVGLASGRREQARTPPPISQATAIPRHCPSEPAPRVIEIREVNPNPDSQQHKEQRKKLQELRSANTTVLLGPDVVLDFAKAAAELPIEFGPCTSLLSVASFFPDRVEPATPAAAASAIGSLPRPSARTPRSSGPLLKFGSHSADVTDHFLEVRCREPTSETPIVPPNDHVRISGFRLEGPRLGQQKVDQFGILIRRCLDIEISNMEIYGWGGAGIRVFDDGAGAEGPGQEPPNNRPGDRIGRPQHVRILNNYIHHNQHQSERESVDCDWSWSWLGIPSLVCWATRQHAAGYGVDVHHGAWAQIFFNLFDVNRHAIAASGRMGGYDARWNLTLKGGGVHGRAFNHYTHQFDIHGSGDNGMGGHAGVQTWYVENAFQYRNDHAIKIRGTPKLEINIGDNIFPHDGLEDDWGDDAIHIRDRDDIGDTIHLRPRNVIDVDTYGRYGVCDFDADGIDDLFLATGKSWWFSSTGEFPWSFLIARRPRLEELRLGYFDDDLKCDVLTQSGDEWVISSGGTGPWTGIGRFGSTLDPVAFGRFDPDRRDQRPGVTRRTTHAFRRLSSGQWQVTPLTDPPDWENVERSQLQMSDLRFGDFTGDGVTDVLGVIGGRWAISESARGNWTPLNPTLGDDVSKLLIADLNHNNIDDLLKLTTTTVRISQQRIRIVYTWYVSDDGRSRWRKLKEYKFDHLGTEPILSGRRFAGRFGAAPGGGVILTGSDRVGQFFSPAERVVGRPPDWRGLFGY